MTASPTAVVLDRETLSRATDVAASVTDPELPMLTLRDLGVLRSVSASGDTLVVTITPTYSGCPALATMRADLQVALRRAGFERVEVRTALSPAWSSDWLTSRGRAALRAAGISPPEPGRSRPGPVPLTLSAPALSTPARGLACPQCGSTATAELSRFGSTACKALHVCHTCGEPFDHFKEI